MRSPRGGEPGEEQTVDDILELLGLGPLADKPALGLPLGTARLVELGRALASEPTVLLLDEPSSGLDSSESAQVEETLQVVARERRVSVLLVEHDVEMVMRMCSNIYPLEFGTMIANGTPDYVRSNPAVRAAYLGEEVEVPSTSRHEDFEPESIIELGAADGALAPRLVTAVGDSSATSASALLSVDGLSVRYGDALALSEVSFQVGAGQALAVLGANGAGKSSLARALSGLVPASGGSVVLDGEPIEGWSADRIPGTGDQTAPVGWFVVKR